MKRIYHPVQRWEEMRFNMWGAAKDRKAAKELAIRFTGDAALYGSFMRRVCEEWPISCENALTDTNLNRKAWLGHAACALAHQIPEDIVREAWSELTDEQRILANKQAHDAISAWEYHREFGAEIPRTMGISGV